MNKIFITKLSNSIKSQESIYYSYSNGRFQEYKTMSELYSEKPDLISFDWDATVTWLKDKSEEMPLKIIDIEQIAKQLYGRKKDKSQLSPWSLWNIVKPYYDVEDHEDYLKVQNVYYSQVTVEEEELTRLFTQLLTAIDKLYSALIQELNDKNEYNRYYNVERPIRIINLERTYKGISINTENVSEWVIQTSRDVYKLRNQLQLEYGIISLSDKNIILKKIEDKALVKDAKELIQEKGYYFFLKDSKSRHPLIDLLYHEKKTTTNLNALLSIGALKPTNKRIYPIYDSFGTITARTKIKTPNLQNLSKKYRTIIEAEKDKQLLYIDYAQFEAGILAHNSKDELLITEYNTSDIYDEIGKRIEIKNYISDTEEQRKFCKSLFYKFSYGMDIKNHLNVLKDYQLMHQKTILSPLINSAFNKYKTLEKYRDQIKKELMTIGAIGTHNGNFRYKLENEQNLSWALSQRIQGTASLILKKAIIKLRKEDSEIEFLIPMHDAALFQVPKSTVLKKMKFIKEVFINEFVSECPSIIASAKFKGFCD